MKQIVFGQVIKSEAVNDLCPKFLKSQGLFSVQLPVGTLIGVSESLKILEAPVALKTNELSRSFLGFHEDFCHSLSNLNVTLRPDWILY